MVYLHCSDQNFPLRLMQNRYITHKPTDTRVTTHTLEIKQKCGFNVTQHHHPATPRWAQTSPDKQRAITLYFLTHFVAHVAVITPYDVTASFLYVGTPETVTHPTLYPPELLFTWQPGLTFLLCDILQS